MVVGVPCNQFGAHEPGSAEQIATFCERNYGVSFPILEKQNVNGPKRSPLYTFLVDSEAGTGKDIEWNFGKFVVGRDGAVAHRFAPNRCARRHRTRRSAGRRPGTLSRRSRLER